MYVESDAFTVAYDPARIASSRIMEGIRRLGYRPRKADQVLDDGVEADTVAAMPSALRALLDESRVSATPLVFLDFYAPWCAPCRTLEETVLTSSSIKTALQCFTVAKIDTDKETEITVHYRVKALPTLIVIDRNGDEIYRCVGSISTDLLQQSLDSLAIEYEAETHNAGQ